MPVPAGLPSELTEYLAALEQRVGQVEGPMGYVPAFLTVSTNLTTASAAAFAATWAILTDLHTAAYSDGAHWRRIDTGATIV